MRRKPMGRRLAWAAALVPALLGMSATAASAESVRAGHLDWGVKQSFRGYVAGVGQGTITTSAEVTVNDDGTFRFPVASGTYDEETGALEVEFAGSVRFVGHGGQLDAEFLSPRVVLGGSDDPVLILDANSLALGGTSPVFYDDTAFGALDLTGLEPEVSETSFVLSGVPAALTEEGVPAFADFYAADTALDPVNLDLVLGDPVAPKIVARKRARLNARVAKLANLVCGSDPCSVDAPKAVRVRVGRKRIRAKVLKPSLIAAEGKGKLRVRFSKKGARKLAGRSANVRVPVTVSAGELNTSKRVVVPVKGAGR